MPFKFNLQRYNAVFLNAIAMQLLLAAGGGAAEVKKCEEVDLGESEVGPPRCTLTPPDP